LPIRSRVLPSHPEATVAARRFVRETLAGDLDPQLLADAILLTNELVTNAIRHAGAKQGPIEVVISLDDRVLRVTVRDTGPGFDPAQTRERTAVGGWGLDLVKNLSSRWGVQELAAGTDVWFEIDLFPSGR
jgi:anti-sigma regulatory factor (Ser/Thr protein kinase)